MDKVKKQIQIRPSRPYLSSHKLDTNKFPLNFFSIDNLNNLNIWDIAYFLLLRSDLGPIPTWGGGVNSGQILDKNQ